MARIPLRTYDREIENLIDRGQIEEAIAHAKNILKQYPKHIETYRLLGKAYLESQRYSEASDILQRVLSVIPDDFVSQLGMSIIREDEGNLDAAIWHMERAYEVQPFNRAVQDELRRLYGRRDGLEPPRVRLTRGSLVRMYAKGELYPQAIAETRAALAEDPERVDLQVLLARMYFLTGQKVEAAEIASALIGKMAYCLEANHILMDILPNTSRAENAQIFQRRVFDLDPYAQFVSPNAPTSAQVPDQSVMVERVDWQNSAQETQTPDWARNIGVKWEETTEEALPDWLNTINPPSQIAAPEKAPEDEIVPDFMRNAGWSPSNGSPSNQANEEIPPAVDLSGEEDEDNLLSADIPDWLQSMAPQTPAAETDDEPAASWLDDILPAAGLTLAGVGGAIAAQSETTQPDAEEPDWMAAGNQAAAGEPAEPEESELPSWLSELRQSDSAADIEPEPGQASVSQPVDDLPAWLRGESETAAVDSSSSQEDLSTQNADAEPLLWFQEPDQPVEPTASTEMPAWLREEAANQAADGGPLSDRISAAAPSGDLLSTEDIPQPSELPPSDMEFAGEPTEETRTFEIPGWEQETALTPADSIETAVPASAEGSDELPDWLAALGQPDEEALQVEPGAEPAERLNDFAEPQDQTPGSGEFSTEEAIAAAAVPPSSAGPDLNDMDAAMAWLEGLAAKQGADEDSLKISAPEDRTEAPPDWVTNLTPAAAAEEAALEEAQPILERETPPAETDEIPEWLRSIETISPEAESVVSSSAEPAAEALPAEELPDWLREPAVKDSDGNADLLPEWLTAETAVPSEITDETTAAAAVPIKITDETTTAAAVPAEPVEMTGTPPNDIDAAMAWLEGLALKQGADEETLKISNREDRSEIAPDWISELTPVENAAPPAEILSEEKTQPIKIRPDIEGEAPLPAVIEPEIIAQEMPSAETEPSEELPAWLAGLEEEQPAQAAVIEPAQETTESDTIAEIPERAVAAETDWPNEAPPQELPTPAIPEPAGVDLNDMDAAMAWLEALALKQGAEEDTLKITAPEIRSDTTPEWIAALAEKDQPAEPIEELPTETLVEEPAAELPDFQPAHETTMGIPVVPAEEAQAAEELAGETDIPDWLLNYEEEQQLKTQTWQAPAEAAGQVAVQPSAADESVTLWLQRHHPEPGAVPVEDTAGEEISAADWTPPAPVEAEPLPPVQPGDYTEARSALESGKLDEAIELYTRLVRSGEHIDETIDDLNRALDRHPVDVGIWQVLGDAYSKADKIQEALDAYTKAEDLLQ